MNRTGIILSSFVILILVAFTNQIVWKSDKPHSELGFSITHMGISDISGTFNEFSATINSNKEDFSDALVEATIEVASIDTRVKTRDEHLIGVDFFDVEKFPQIMFRSTGIKRIDKGKFTLTGDLTIKDIVKKVELDLTYRGSIENPQTHKTSAGFRLSGIIKRSDFGIGTAFPAPMLSDEYLSTSMPNFKSSNSVG